MTISNNFHVNHQKSTSVLFPLFVYLLPLFNICGLFMLWSTQLKENADLINMTTIFALCTLFITLSISITSIIFTTKGLWQLSSKLLTIIPQYKLNEYLQKKNLDKSSFLNPCAHMLYLLEAINDYIKNINRKTLALEDSSLRIKVDSIYDVLCSNIYNRKHTESIFLQKIETIEAPKILAVALLDIDYFKKVNDTYGHDCGDFILKEISSLILSGLREVDTLGRWGGEEFCMLLEVIDTATAQDVFERIKKWVEERKFIYINNNNERIMLKKTVSIGFTSFDKTKAGTLESIMKRADEALYYSKEHGRNKVTYCEL